MTGGIAGHGRPGHAGGMARACRVPEELRSGPFTIAEAGAAGISKGQLRGSAWRRLCQGWYCWRGYAATDTTNLIPIARGLPEGFAFAGPVAARLHGLDVPVRGRPEVIVPTPTVTSERVEAVVRREDFDPAQMVWRKGFPVTSALRTCFDLAGRLRLQDAVVALTRRWRAAWSTCRHWRSLSPRAGVPTASCKPARRSRWPNRGRSPRWRPGCACCSR